MKELLPCPFCGTNPIVETIGNDYTKSRKITIKCPSCRIQRTDAALRHGFEWLEEVAADQWNSRNSGDVCTCENVDDAHRGTWLTCGQCLKPRKTDMS